MSQIEYAADCVTIFFLLSVWDTRATLGVLDHVYVYRDGWRYVMLCCIILILKIGMVSIVETTGISLTFNAILVFCNFEIYLCWGFINFSERGPLFWLFLRVICGIFWSQRCVGVWKTCGRHFGSLPRKLTICQETLCSLLFQISFLLHKLFFQSCR